MAISKREYYIHKESWDIGDISGAFVSGLIADLGLAGALGYFGIGTGGAIGLAGAGAAMLGTLGIGGLLVAIGFAIYEGTRMADNSIADLLERIDALDYENTPVEGIVSGWIDQLNKLRAVFQLEMPSGTTEEKAKALADRVLQMQAGLDYLSDMLRNWPQVKKHLQDRMWERDPIQFENALKKTIVNYHKIMQYVDSQAKAVAAQRRQETAMKPEQIFAKAREYRQLVVEILSLDSQIKNLWGQPQYSPEESKVIEVGKTILGPEASLTEELLKQIDAVKPALLKIRNELRWLLSEVKRKKGASDRGPAISKRAVSLPGFGPPRPEQLRGQKPGLRKMPVVEDLQRYLNHLKVAYDLDQAPYLKLDGQYGPTTANALVVILNRFPSLVQYIKSQGIPLDKLNDVAFMNDERGGLRFISFITGLFRDLIKKIQGQSQKEISQRDVSPTAPAAQQAGPNCVNKINPTSAEILNCLRGMTDSRIGNMSLYDYMKQQGMDDNEMAVFIYNQFGGWRPSTWSTQIILSALEERRKRLEGKK